jgi:hypothetical protein
MRPHYDGMVCQVLEENNPFQLEGEVNDDVCVYGLTSQGSGEFCAVGVSSCCKCKQACCRTVLVVQNKTGNKINYKLL